MKKYGKTILLGIYAGMAIGLGGFLNILSNTYLDSPAIMGRIIGSLLFPVGLTLVCFLGLNLFTGKIGFIFDNNKNYLGFLGLVYIGNIIGSLIMGGWCLVVFKGVEEIYSVATGISAGKMVLLEPSFWQLIKVFAGAVLCGVLVYVAIFCYGTFKPIWLKILGIFLAIGLFVFLKFDHCIANMFYFTFSWSWGNGLSYLNIGVVTLGNSLGAIALNEGLKAFKKLVNKNEQKSA